MGIASAHLVDWSITVKRWVCPCDKGGKGPTVHGGELACRHLKLLEGRLYVSVHLSTCACLAVSAARQYVRGHAVPNKSG